MQNHKNEKKQKRSPSVDMMIKHSIKSWKHANHESRDFAKMPWFYHF